MNNLNLKTINEIEPECVIRFRCECGRIIEETFPIFDMKEMLKQPDAHEYIHLDIQAVCECDCYFDGTVTASINVGLDES